MATPRRPCLTCGQPHANGSAYCSACQPSYGYGNEGWRGEGGTRDQVLQRARYRCELTADDGCTGDATSVHRLPEYGTVHDGNLAAYVAACAHCHGVVDGARSRRPRRR